MVPVVPAVLVAPVVDRADPAVLAAADRVDLADLLRVADKVVLVRADSKVLQTHWPRF